MENQVSPSQNRIVLSPVNKIHSPVKREVLKNISNSSQVSNGESKLTNTTPVSPSNNNALPVASDQQVSINKSSDESSDSSLDYGSANEDPTNRDDSLIHAFGDIHLNTPKTDGKEKALLTTPDGSARIEFNNLTAHLDSDSPKRLDNSNDENNEQIVEPLSSRKQKVFNIITECFETPDSSFIGDQTLPLSKDSLEIGQDPLNVSSVLQTFTLNTPSIDPILDKSHLNEACSPKGHIESIANQTCDDALGLPDDGIAVISGQTMVEEKNVEIEPSVDDERLSDISGTVKEFSGIETQLNIEKDLPESVSEIPSNLQNDNLDSISNDSIAVLTNGIDENLAEQPVEIRDNVSFCNIDKSEITVLNDESFHLNKTVDVNEPSNIENNQNIQNSIASKDTTIANGESNNDNLNLTCSEPMECDDISFVNTAPDTCELQFEDNHNDNNPSNSEYHKTSTAEHVQPSIPNQLCDEPLDCEDFAETKINPNVTFETHEQENCQINLCDDNNSDNTYNIKQTDVSQDENIDRKAAGDGLKNITESVVTSGDISHIQNKKDDDIVHSKINVNVVLQGDQDNGNVVQDSKTVPVNVNDYNNIEDLNMNTLDPFVTKSRIINTPDKILDDNPLEEINPFSTRSRVLNTPEKLDSPTMELNPFVTKSRIVNTPDKEVARSPSIKREVISDVSVNVITEILNKDLNTYEKMNSPTVEINPCIAKSRIVNTPEKEIARSPSIKQEVLSEILSKPESSNRDVEQSNTELSPTVSKLKDQDPSPCVSDEEILSGVLNDAEMKDDISSETYISSLKESDNVSVNIDKINIRKNSSTMVDDCIDEEFKRPLVLQSELNIDLDALDSDSDTLSVSSLNQDINPFETKCMISNSTEFDEDNTLTLNKIEIIEALESTLNKTLVNQDIKPSINEDDKIQYDSEDNINYEDNAGNPMSPRSPTSNIHLSETVVISDTPDLIYKNNAKNVKSPDYNENTPKTGKLFKKPEEINKNDKDHHFVSPLAHDKRVKELVKRKITDKKVSNLSPMSRCGDLMGLSPVAHTDGDFASQCHQISDEVISKDPFFCDVEEEFAMPANFVKENFDFLLSCGSNPANQYQCKESLLLKFDPLLSTGRPGLPTGVRPGRETIPESPRLEEDTSAASGLAESCSSDSSPLSTSTAEFKTLSKMSSMEQSLGAPSPKVLNVIPQPVEKPTQVVTPAISTRQSLTPLSSKNNQAATPAKSVTSAIAAIDRLISLGGTPPPPPVVVQPKEPEMDPRLLAELQSVRELLARQEEELRKVEEQKQGLENQLSDAISREQTLIERLNDKTIDRRQMDTVLEEYERTMTQFIGERDVEKRQWEEERAALIRERDEANAHLANMEHSFNDIHAKYERCKQMIQGYKTNEEILKETVRCNDEASKKQLERYEHLRQHAMSQLEIANQEIDSVKKSSQAEIIKLQAMLKKSDIQVSSLQETLAQKTKDIEELTAICDELIQKVG